MSKTVKIFSFGRKWPDYYPKAPEERTIQYVVDVRSAIPDPGEDRFGLDGSAWATIEWILAQKNVQVWLEWMCQKTVWGWVRDFEENSEFKELHVFFMCEGGFQRSVFVAERIADKLRAFGRECTVEHLTKELTRKDNLRSVAK